MADINVPSWFNAKDYLANKLVQLKAVEPEGNWTAESLTKVLEENGYKGDDGAYKHFTDFGMDENVSPNALFNVSEYLAAKAEQLNAMSFEGKNWSAASVYDAIKAAGMNVGNTTNSSVPKKASILPIASMLKATSPPRRSL